MCKFGTLYIKGNSFFHNLNPVTKIIIFILWMITVFMFLDIRVGIFLLFLGAILLRYSQIPAKIIKNLFLMVISFSIINVTFIILITPEYGSTLTGTSTVILKIKNFEITLETLFYVLTLSVKYLSLLPIALIFIFTTHPSKLAVSLNKAGLNYKIAYIVNLIFRCIPSIQYDYKNITNAQAARGINYGKDEKSKLKRIKNIFLLTIPLVNSSMERIDKITNAMELRCFGSKKGRTWYINSTYSKKDILTITITILFFLIFIFIKSTTGKTLFYPF